MDEGGRAPIYGSDPINDIIYNMINYHETA